MKRRRARPMSRRLSRTLTAGALIAANVAVASAALPAEAACNRLTFNAIPSAVNWLGGAGSGYGVFDAANRTQAVMFTVRRRSGACSYFITATTLGADTFTNRQLRSGNNALNFNVYTTSTRTNIIRDVPSAGPNDVLVGGFSPGGAAVNNGTYYFDISPQQVVPPGFYQTTMQFKLFEGDLINNTLVASVQITHEANVLSATEISLGTPGQAFDPSRVATSFDFGVINGAIGQGQRQTSISLGVRTNSGYTVNLQSQNGGVMRLSNPRDTSAVPYILTVNGALANLSGGKSVKVAQGTGLTGAGGIALPLNVSVNPPQGSAQPSAGTYTDAITVLVSGQ